MKATIKEWFDKKLAQELNLKGMYSLEIFCGVKETEKAVYAIFYTGFNNTGTKAMHRAHWIPKSAIENIEALKIVNDYEKAIEMFKMAF